jgi:hypothetical protein
MPPPHALLTLLLVTAASCAATTTTNNYTRTRAGIMAKRDAFSAAMRLPANGGFTASNGDYSFFFLADCAKYKLKSCFALNADSPYDLLHAATSCCTAAHRRGGVLCVCECV